MNKYYFEIELDSDLDSEEVLNNSKLEQETIEKIEELDLVKDVERISDGPIYSYFAELEMITGIGFGISNLKTSYGGSRKEINDLMNLVARISKIIRTSKDKKMIFEGDLRIAKRVNYEPQEVFEILTKKFESIGDYKEVNFNYECNIDYENCPDEFDGSVRRAKFGAEGENGIAVELSNKGKFSELEDFQDEDTEEVEKHNVKIINAILDEVNNLTEKIEESIDG